MRTRSVTPLAAGGALALGASLLPSIAFAAEGDIEISGDTYIEVIFDHAVNGWDGENWSAECPPEFPYLSSHHSESDTQVGFGLHIAEETKEALHVVQGGFLDFSMGPKLEKLENGTQVFIKNSGTVSNWSIVRQHLTIKMECTTDLGKAWLSKW